MNAVNKLIRIYTGTEIHVILLKNKLEENGISSSIQNDSNDSFFRGTPIAIDLYIKQSDLENAEQIISDFITKNSNPARCN